MAVKTTWAELKRRFEDPGIQIYDGTSGEPLGPGAMLHIDESHIPVWIVNTRIWIDAEGGFVTPVPSFIHLPVPACG